MPIHSKKTDVNITSEHVLGHLLGALDDDEQQQVDTRLEQDPECCQELMRWRRQLAALEMLRPDYEPSPGLADRTCRFVVGHKATIASSRCAMSPIPSPPNWMGRTRWLDVSVVAILFIAASIVLLPAIYNSRFRARLATSQEDLRQFSSALTQYSQDHSNSLLRMAGNRQINPSGVIASHLVKAGFTTDSPRIICPDAWLAVQDMLEAAAFKEPLVHHEERVVKNVSYIVGPTLFGSSSMLNIGAENDAEVSPAPLPATLALLGGAPIAASESAGDSPNVRGRNMLFEDGHVSFFPCSLRQGTSDILLTDSPASCIFTTKTTTDR